MTIRFDFDPGKCTACGACAIACMDENDIDVEGGQKPYRRVYNYETSEAFFAVSIACLHCPDAPCADACPLRCFFRDDRTGLIRTDNSRCVGCRSCERSCPYGAVSFRPVSEGRVRMEKCHGCMERLDAGLVPACVQICPSGALSVNRTEDRDARERLKEFYIGCDPRGFHTI